LSERHHICAKCVHGVIEPGPGGTTDDRYPCPECEHRDVWTKARFTGESDRALSEHAMRLDARIIEHDAYCCCDDPCLVEERVWLRAHTWELDRRAETGEQVVDPNEPTLEERLGPWGLEWELEQREREEGRA
jgi:hypothetical protein